MNNSFDELTKGLAQSVTRRGALKQFGTGLAAMVLAFFGLTRKSHADPFHGCQSNKDCPDESTVCCQTVYSNGKVCADKAWCVERNKKGRWV